MKWVGASFAIAFATILAALPPPAWADYNKGIAAYERGDYPTAHRELAPLAAQGDAGSQSVLGWMYEKGLGVPANLAAASAWYRKAAEQGDAYAQAALGAMYLNGHGLTKDVSEAALWWKKAADQGLAEAQNSLGDLHRKGLGVVQDFDEALRWYKKAAEQGHADALFNLGVVYGKGIGQLQDYVQSHMWFDLSISRLKSEETRVKAVKNRAFVAKHMTKAQLSEARLLRLQWVQEFEAWKKGRGSSVR